MFFTDYGTKKEYLDVRFSYSTENKDKWKKIKKVGTSNATSEDIKGILFGEKSENWNNHDDYKTFKHNCKHYAKENSIYHKTLRSDNEYFLMTFSDWGFFI